MDTQDKCDELIEHYGYIPQAIPLNAWRTVFPPHKAKWFHHYYSKAGAPELVKDGRDLAWHPMKYGTQLLEKREQDAENEKYIDKICEIIFGKPEPRDQSERPPSS
jgi:hypothetical protein